MITANLNNFRAIQGSLNGVLVPGDKYSWGLGYRYQRRKFSHFNQINFYNSPLVPVLIPGKKLIFRILDTKFPRVFIPGYKNLFQKLVIRNTPLKLTRLLLVAHLGRMANGHHMDGHP